MNAALLQFKQLTLRYLYLKLESNLEAEIYQILVFFKT